MILFEGKYLSYNDAVSKLKSLQDDKEQSEDELSDIKDKADELEGGIRQLTRQINIILDQIKPRDLSKFLPTHLKYHGCKLTEIDSIIKNESLDFWGCKPCPKLKLTILEDKDGNVIREWYHNPSLSDLLEVAV